MLSIQKSLQPVRMARKCELLPPPPTPFCMVPEAAVEYARHAAFAASQAESSAAYAASQARVVASSARAALDRIPKIIAAEQMKWWAKPEWAEPGCDHKNILDHPIIKKILLPFKIIKASGMGLLVDSSSKPVLASVAAAVASRQREAAVSDSRLRP
eukprot:6068141-Amphidinium_carterae.1